MACGLGSVGFGSRNNASAIVNLLLITA